MPHKRLKPKYLIFILLFVAAAIFSATWDLNRLNTDFKNLFTLLRSARADAFYKDTTIIIPSIARVDYDTTLGKDMIVFTWRGTEQYNKRVHGGEITLRSVLGFRRYIHVNCTGLVKEGLYPEDE